MADIERLLVSCPAIPKTLKIKVDGKDTTVPTPPELVAWGDQIRTMLDVAFGNRREAEPLRFVTMQELVNSGLVQGLVSGGRRLVRNAATVSGSLTVDLPDVTVDDRVPDTPASVTATATFKAIILTWTLPAYDFHSRTEIWRNSSNNLSTAVLHKETSGATWSDDVGTGSTYYYWVRHVGTNGKKSSFANGVTATTGKMTGYNEIADATIRNAQIENLAVDNAKINDVSAGKLAAGTITAGSIYLGSTAFLLDGGTKRMTITGGSSQAVELGSLSYDTSKYGLHIKNAAGTTVFKADQSIIEVDASILKLNTAPQFAMATMQETRVPDLSYGTATNVEDGATQDFTCTTGLGSTYTPPYDQNYTISTGGNFTFTSGNGVVSMAVLFQVLITVRNTSATAAKAGSVGLTGTVVTNASGVASVGGVTHYFRLAAGTASQTFEFWNIGGISGKAGDVITPKVRVINLTGASDGLISVDSVKIRPRYLPVFS